MYKFIIIILIILAVIAGVFLWKIKVSSQDKPHISNEKPIEGEAIIIMTNDGFFPSEIRIKAGANVRFINDSKYWHWPASDLHPSHTLYSEFDPKKPIGPGEEWSFVFEKTGVWGFHDHLSPQITGEVIVAE